MLAALDHVESEFRDGTFAFRDGDEDIHTAIERRVTEIAGSPGAKMHTGRFEVVGRFLLCLAHHVGHLDRLRSL